MLEEYQRNILKLQIEIQSWRGKFRDQGDSTNDKVVPIEGKRHEALKRAYAKSSIKVSQVNSGKQNRSTSIEHTSAMTLQYEENLSSALYSLKSIRISSGKSGKITNDKATDNTLSRKNGGDNLTVPIKQSRQGCQAYKKSCEANFYEYSSMKRPVSDYSFSLNENTTQFNSNYVDETWSPSVEATFQPISTLLSSTPHQQ